MRFNRLRAILHELRLAMREQRVLRQERVELILLGRAAVSASSLADLNVGEPEGRVRHATQVLQGLVNSITQSLAADRMDYEASAPWMRPVVVLRGCCTRAVLRHRIARERRALTVHEEAIGSTIVNQPLAFARHPRQVQAVADTRATLRLLREDRNRRLEQFGGSALPRWLPHLRRESAVLGRALWLQLKPNVLPRGSALVGLTVGWWLANTYTDSHFRSMLHSLGIGSGGKRVVSGETYKAMMFWLPILAAALFAYLADRAHFLIHRRYSRPTPPA